MAYVLLDENGVIIQKQPYDQEGFIEAPDEVECGMVQNQDGSFFNPNADKEPDPLPAPRLEKIVLYNPDTGGEVTVKLDQNNQLTSDITPAEEE